MASNSTNFAAVEFNGISRHGSLSASLERLLQALDRRMEAELGAALIAEAETLPTSATFDPELQILRHHCQLLSRLPAMWIQPAPCDASGGGAARLATRGPGDTYSTPLCSISRRGGLAAGTVLRQFDDSARRER